MAVAYLLTDQAYAVCIARWDESVDPRRRLPFFFGAGLLLWVVWQLCTIAGVLIGPAVPEDVPLDFAVPLVFLVLLIPVLTNRPSLVAAAVGGLDRGRRCRGRLRQPVDHCWSAGGHRCRGRSRETPRRPRSSRTAAGTRARR